MVTRIVENLKKAGISEIYLITNNSFFHLFKKEIPSIKIINNNVNSLEERKGAVKDIHFAVKESKIDDNLLIIGGDNLFFFDISEFIDYFNKNKENAIVIQQLSSKEDGKLKYGIVEIDKERIISLEEKPENPKTNLASTCIYILKKETLPLIESYLNQDNKSDNTGDFISWLASNTNVNGWFCDASKLIDIGSLDQIEHLISLQ